MSLPFGTEIVGGRQDLLRKVVSSNAPADPAAGINRFHRQLLQRKSELEDVVPSAREYFKAVASFDRGYAVAPLGEAGMDFDREDRVIRLNSGSLRRILSCYPAGDEHRRSAAALLFAMHETFHIVQGIGRYPDVARVKQDAGSDVMSFLDLRSTTVAANLIAACNALNFKDFAGKHRAGFKFLWIDVAQHALTAFPIYTNVAKCHQYFGHLLMSAALLGRTGAWSTWTTHHTLWPVWSPDWRFLEVLSNDHKMVVPPTEVNPQLLRRVAEQLCANNVEGAFADARGLLPLLHFSTYEST